MSTNLLNFKKEVFSSSMGEDGIIEYIFSIIPSNKICVDVGAWDGIHISNTRNLIVNHSWSSLQVECDAVRHEQLIKNSKEYPVKTSCCFINTTDNSLDRLVEDSGFSTVDFLSIDIDGADYEIFDSIKNFLPSVLCIEVSTGINPISQEVLPLDKATELSGQSLGAMTALANSKGYQLIAFTGNAFYIKNELYPLLGITDNKIETMYQNFLNVITQDHKDYLISQSNRFNLNNPFLQNPLV